MDAVGFPGHADVLGDGTGEVMLVGVWHHVRDRLECRRVRPLMQSLLDGELDDAQRRRVAQHLAACRRCGLEAATYAALMQRLRGLGDPTHDDAVARLEAFVNDLTSGGEPTAGA